MSDADKRARELANKGEAAPEEMVWGFDPVRKPARFAFVPWLLNDFESRRDQVAAYAVGNRLPGGIPMSALEAPVWARSLAVPELALSKRGAATLAERRTAYARGVYMHVYRLGQGTVVPTNAGLDTFRVRRVCEERYANVLSQLSNSYVARWDGSFGVHNEALLLRAPQIPADFRYTPLRSESHAGWLDWARTARSRTGFLVPYESAEVDFIHPAHRAGRFIQIPADWHQLEMPRGCPVELPPVCTYLASELIDLPTSGWWTVAYTEFMVNIAVVVLREVYDHYRLWFVQPKAREFLRQLDLRGPLGGNANVRELGRLLEVIERLPWSERPHEWNKRAQVEGQRIRDRCPGRGGYFADFVYYDPWICTELPT